MAFAVRKKIEPSEDWRDVFFDFLDTRLDKMLEEYSMADLREISKAVFQEKADILGHMILGLIERKFGHLLDQQKCACPQCGRNMQSNGKLSRRIETLAGRLELSRPYFYCRECRMGYFPGSIPDFL